jgi:hypothetical protein
VAPIETCDSNLGEPGVGAPCKLSEACTLPDGCCTRKLVCSGGAVYDYHRDCSQCPPCTGDEGCAQLNWCIDKLCQPCPMLTKCPECPAGQKPQLRNGCPSCECG